jgi:hypothetical protein
MWLARQDGLGTLGDPAPQERVQPAVPVADSTI